MTAPANDATAVTQHADGDAHAWERCDGCGAARGEQCYNLALRRSVMLGQVVTRTGTRKRRPCAGRTWARR